MSCSYIRADYDLATDTTTVTHHDSGRGWLSEALSRPMTPMEKAASEHANSINERAEEPTPDDELFTNSHLQKVKSFIKDSPDEPVDNMSIYEIKQEILEANNIKPFDISIQSEAVIPLSQTIVKAIIT